GAGDRGAAAAGAAPDRRGPRRRGAVRGAAHPAGARARGPRLRAEPRPPRARGPRRGAARPPRPARGELPGRHGHAPRGGTGKPERRGRLSPATLSERVRAHVSDGELERRFAALRSGMEEAGLDALVLHTNVDSLGGYVKYVSDLTSAGGYPTSVVFPLEAPM